MTSVDVFYQGEGIQGIGQFEAEATYSFAVIKLAIIERHRLKLGTRLYLEDNDAPVDEWHLVGSYAGRGGVKIHLHRCRHIAAAINFNGDTVRHRFGPGTTLARAKAWAAERMFGMTPAEAGEHALQISGTQEQPSPGVHLGALASCPTCSTAFDLVPSERVNGACGPGLRLPDERAFRDDIGKPACLFAAAAGRWRIVSIAWPFVLAAVAGTGGREYLLRLDCTGYPREAPTGGPWDAGLDTVLPFEHWPGGRSAPVFRPNKRDQMPALIWRPAGGISHYMERVVEMLNCAEDASSAEAAA